MSHPPVPAGPGGRRPLHLRTTLILTTLALLTAICIAIGVFSHLAMSTYLTGQLDEALKQAATRAGFPGGRPPGDDARPFRGIGPDDIDPGDAAGQRPGTLNAVFADGEAQNSGLVLDDGTTASLVQADLDTLAGIDPSAGPEEVTLSTGDYRVDAAELPTELTTDGTVLVTGLSTTERDSTLVSLDITVAGLSLAGLVLTGLAGTAIIRRSLRPLEELSAVATSVSRLPLSSGEVAIPVRVPPAAAQPGTEVGTVGLALNEMIDHVTSALRERHASEMKVRQFVADASHELRTPLTSIRGYTELVLMSESVSPSGRSALERVDSESRRMSSLVEDLLLLARLDEGQRGEVADVDLTELVIETTSDARVAAPGYSWGLDLPEDPVEIRAVGTEIRQILINLLSNAYKHTPPGTSVSTALTVAPGPDGGTAILTVTDSGPGIDPAFLDTIFTRFSRGDSARTATEGSTGLGLAIVHALVQANGGDIRVTSEPGRTQFRVQLPLASALTQGAS
ncbi:Probable sensor histidine kinase TcrY [Arthrobacter agilis]|uniref:HAMP domain-containing sensor histidine kinase n=1 Tax=Arthrobacter agilis TaxID=37921 RepID=UPI000F6FD186|nr:HAMP domain-containing sensor histidine kinase [Arthrobacter agilis]VDR33658.1 Probable sensor histidine kinase TcrY [Arthrobacter agilis]